MLPSALEDMMLNLLQWSGFHHALWGALGGAAYVVGVHGLGFRVRIGELFTRPITGALMAFISTEGLGWPDHQVSLMVGLVGVQALGLLILFAERFVLGKFEIKPGLFASRFIQRDTIGAAIQARIDELNAEKTSDSK